MNCQATQKQLTEYVDDLLEGKARDQVQAHLAACPHCAALAQEMTQTRHLLQVLPRRQTSADFEARLAQRLVQTPQKPKRLFRLPIPSFSMPLLRPALAFCAAAAAIAGAVFMHPWTPAAPAPAPAEDYAGLISQSVALHERDVAAQPLAAPATTGIAPEASGWSPQPAPGQL